MSAWVTMGNEEEGWDLFAVVRSCRAASRPLAPLPEEAEKVEISVFTRQEFTLPRSEPALSSSYSDPVAAGNYYTELEKFCLPFFAVDQKPKATLFPRSPSPPSAAASVPATTRFRTLPRSTPRSKRRRNQQKKVVCHVPADGLATDKWAWRKYGQKPIKGSPYPRGYYRCSSSKGCSARKQVERSKTDPEMFVITYTAEHNHPVPTHRNSLAGSTRQKFPSKAVATGEQGSLSENSQSTTAAEEQLLRGVKKGEDGSSEEDEVGEDEEGEEEEEEEEDEGMLLVEDMEVVGEDEVFFMGVDKNMQGSPATTTEAVSSFFDVEDSFLFQPGKDCTSAAVKVSKVDD